MWCVAELNEEYVRKLEDVLELYERPYNGGRTSSLSGRETRHALIRMCDRHKPPGRARFPKRDSEYER